MEPVSRVLQKKIMPMEHSRCPTHGIPMLGINLSDSDMPENIKLICPKCSSDRTEQYLYEEEHRKLRERQDQINERLRNSMIGPRFKGKTFKNFKIPTEKQKEVLVQAQHFADNMDGSVGLIFSGRPGTGKNHLASAVCNHVITNCFKIALVTTAFKIIRTIKASWSRDSALSEQAVIDGYVKKLDLLVIDEIGVQHGSDTERLYLTEIINDRYEWLKSTILLTNLSVKELIPMLGERVIDRFREGGRVLVFDWESYRGKEKEGTDGQS